MLVRGQRGDAALLTGSANLTRRNLDDFNLETNVVVQGRIDRAPFPEVQAYFDEAWNNTESRHYSVDYAHYKDESWWRRGLYRFMEWSGISSF